MSSAKEGVSITDPAIVTLEVGLANIIVAVHQDLLCKHSPFFTAALQGQWKEGAERTVKLPLDDAVVVRIYVLWLYRHELALYDLPFITTSDLMIAAYLFGEKVQDADFKDAITDALLHYESEDDLLLTSATISKAYQGTPVGSPLRRLLVDISFSERCASAIVGDEDREFLTDIARKSLAQNEFSRDDKRPPWEVDCHYHQHTKYDDCFVWKYHLHHKKRS